MENDRIGHDTISVPVPRGRRPRVIAIVDRDTNSKYDLPLKPQRWCVGSSPSCDIVLNDPYVSNLHCILHRQSDERLIIRDCESKNGTIVDNAPIMARELTPGSLIRLGGASFVAIGDGDGSSAIAQLRGSDPIFRSEIARALRVARTHCSVLVVGETGTGKELIAQAIHEASDRCEGPFVPINCGAFPRELIGSELFGHLRGAFTGATDNRDGVFVQADGGTLFLDELGELELNLQPTLLRVLETRRVRPVGSVQERHVDVRFVAATNRLDGLGTDDSPIRFDLYQRLAAVTIQLTPLRDRRGDIPELAQIFLDELSYQYGHRAIRPRALEALSTHSWPGNVRELKQTILRAVTLTTREIDVSDLGLPVTRPWGATTLRNAPGRMLAATSSADPGAISGHDQAMRETYAAILERTGSVRAAARELGIPKSTFADKAHRLGIDLRRKPRRDDD